MLGVVSRDSKGKVSCWEDICNKHILRLGTEVSVRLASQGARAAGGGPAAGILAGSLGSTEGPQNSPEDMTFSLFLLLTY
jgi:hypothetical protein